MPNKGLRLTCVFLLLLFSNNLTAGGGGVLSGLRESNQSRKILKPMPWQGQGLRVLVNSKKIGEEHEPH